MKVTNFKVNMVPYTVKHTAFFHPISYLVLFVFEEDSLKWINYKL